MVSPFRYIFPISNMGQGPSHVHRWNLALSLTSKTLLLLNPLMQLSTCVGLVSAFLS